MKGNTKGFTLVELLAVIVILAIIALITVPAILNVINDARQKGAEDKAWGTIDAVRLAYTQEQGFGEGAISETSGDYDVCFGDTCENKKVGNTNVNVSGEKPSSGKVTINLSDGTISCTDLEFKSNGHFKCSSDGTTMNCSVPE